MECSIWNLVLFTPHWQLNGKSKFCAQRNKTQKHNEEIHTFFKFFLRVYLFYFVPEWWREEKVCEFFKIQFLKASRRRACLNKLCPTETRSLHMCHVWCSLWPLFNLFLVEFLQLGTVLRRKQVGKVFSSPFCLFLSSSNVSLMELVTFIQFYLSYNAKDM